MLDDHVHWRRRPFGSQLIEWRARVFASVFFLYLYLQWAYNYNKIIDKLDKILGYTVQTLPTHYNISKLV